MKSILIFILFLILGIFLAAGYGYLSYQQSFLITPNNVLTTNFSLANAPNESLKGTIASMSGTINWLSRTAKNPIKLNSPRTIQQGEELGTGKNSNAIVAIQNTAVILSSNSHVNFIQMLPINLVIEQDEGTVLYKNAGQNALSINALNLITALNNGWAKIAVDQNTETVTITVDRGSVTEGYEDSQNNSNVVTVNAGQEFVFDDTTQEGTIE